MAFPTKVIPLSAAFKTWLTQNYAPKVHYHDDRYSLLGHTHSDITDAFNMGGLPDFSRSTLIYQQTASSRYRVWIIKLNVPGCLFFTQNNYSVDTDHAVIVGSHPGYLFNPRNENITIRANGSNTTKTRPRYLERKALLGGNSVPDGDTWCMGWYTIVPGTSTYIYPSSTLGGRGWDNYRWIFVPFHCVGDTVPASKYFTVVGVSEDVMVRDNLNGCGFLFDQAVTSAFVGDWKSNLTSDNAIYIPTIFVSGTRWNWNSVNNSDNGSDIGVRFNMFDACATGKNRRWLQYNDRNNRQIYWDANGYWVLCEGNNQRYRATDSNGTKDPWDLTWYNSYDSNTAVCTLTKRIVM